MKLEDNLVQNSCSYNSCCKIFEAHTFYM